jgi:hypothetical protein
VVQTETKTAKEVLEEMRGRGVGFKLNGENVSVRGHKRLNEQDWITLRSLKPEIVAILKGNEYKPPPAEKSDLGFWDVIWRRESGNTAHSFKVGSFYSNDPYVDVECRSLTSVNSEAGSFISINPAHVEKLTDGELVALIRNGAKSARLDGAIWRVRKVVEDFSRYCSGLWTIEEFQAAYDCDYELLYRHQDKPDIKDLLNRFDPIWRGNVRNAGYVYCLSDQQGHYKLGRTTQLQQRIKSLGTQPPFKIQLLFTHYVFDAPHYEKSLHLHFAHKRMNGEWFALGDDDLELIKTGKWVDAYKQS